MRHLAALALLSLAHPATEGPTATAADNLLLNPGAEAGKGDLPSVWFAATGSKALDGLAMVRSTDRAHGGRASLLIRYEGPELDTPTSFNWAQPLADVPAGKTVRLSAWIRTADADNVNVCLQCWSPNQELLALASTPVFRGDQEWVEARSRPVRVPEGTETALVRAAMTGRGQAWFDDIAVVVVDPLADPAEPTPPAQAPARPTVDKALAKAAGGAIVKALPIRHDGTAISYLPDFNHTEVDWVGLSNNGNRVLLKLPPVDAKEAAVAGRKFVVALYSTETTAGEQKPSPIEVVELLADWRPGTSWKTMPKSAEATTSTAEFGDEDGWKLFDVTPLVQTWAKAPSKNGRAAAIRFAKEDAEGNGQWSGYMIVSSEGRANRRPLLLIVDPSK